MKSRCKEAEEGCCVKQGKGRGVNKSKKYPAKNENNLSSLFEICSREIPAQLC